MLLVGLQFVIVAFPGHRYLLFKQVLPGLIDVAPDVISQPFPATVNQTWLQPGNIL